MVIRGLKAMQFERSFRDGESFMGKEEDHERGSLVGERVSCAI